ncbi:MAG TPA: bifunctional diaminohydroxyphosphoribosylaminopyrimidine deaminase/5-amino-6-(5-phosphoribosylamino)uracil reductase RibD [Thermodesulfobacteriota bacterium]|nr:bifunctional diaminohydroxyphosphoribosylaminopyrimidine deaminase/5-amino-6-(5-phosphoribosylamino)uracil reductase RibD [Thermodesulfobacteriota bacterium]
MNSVLAFTAHCQLIVEHFALIILMGFLLMTDEQWMKQVLRLAEKGRGRTSPNPMVGAVLVKGGKIVGKGYHAKAGEAHAEIIALQQAGESARGSTLYINLEPCIHYGRTPPCAPRVVEAQVKRVVLGIKDPNPQVKGRGIKQLREAGVDVQMGVLEKECQRINEAFFKYMVKEEPFVILKVASTLDGKIATRGGDSKWITGETSRRFVHRLRDQVDGVLVGIGTVLKDDPMLTTRIEGGRDPYRIVLDSRLRIPERARIFEGTPSRVIIATTKKGSKEKMERLRERGVQVLIFDSKGGRVNLKTCLKRLAAMGVMTLLVEGGSRVNGSFLDERAVDKFYFFFSPKWIGDPEAPGVFGGNGVRDLREVIKTQEIHVRKMGDDFLLKGYVQTGSDGCLQEL